MRNIILITDGSPQGAHAMTLAETFAKALNGRVLSTGLKTRNYSQKLQMVPANQSPEDEKENEQILVLNSEKELVNYIQHSQAWLVIATASNGHSGLNLQTLLGRLHCPLLVLPPDYQASEPRQLSYLTDLRYSRDSVLRYLTNLSQAFKAAARVDHLSIGGVPDLADSYAPFLFEERTRHIGRPELGFNNIKKAGVSHAADVLINGLGTDLLLLVNREYHFSELFGSGLHQPFPENLRVPVMIFPY